LARDQLIDAWYTTSLISPTKNWAWSQIPDSTPNLLLVTSDRIRPLHVLVNLLLT
jgi:hypothetical protein